MFGVISVSAFNVDFQSVKLKTDGIDSEYDIRWNEKQNRLLVDSDFVVKYFDAEVEIDGNVAEIRKNNHKLCFETDNEFHLMDDLGGRKIDCFIEIEDEKAYLPLRYMCEAFWSVNSI